MKRKIIACTVLNIAGFFVNLYVSYMVHTALMEQSLSISFPRFEEAFTSIITHTKHLHLFGLIQIAILALSIVLIIGTSKYKTDEDELIPGLKIPARAGEGQHGNARFMTKKEIDQRFRQLRLLHGTDLVQRILANGELRKSHIIKYSKNKGEHKEQKLVSVDNKPIFNKAGLVVGKKDQYNCELIYCIDKDIHSLIIGSTGCGKTRCLVIPSICTLALAGESMVMTDPKGELYAYCKEYLESLGYDVYALDFNEPAKSDCFNPLQNIIDAVNNDDIDLAQTFAWDLVCFIVEKSEKAEPIWQNGEMSVIAAAILCVVYDNRDYPQFQNLTNVYWFIANMCKPIPLAMGKTTTPMIEYIKTLADDHPAKPLLGISQIAPSKTAGSFYTSALTSLRLYTSKAMYSMTNSCDFDFESIGKRKTALFFIVPDQNTTFYPVVTLLVSQMYEQLVKFAKTVGNRLPIRVNFMLDEFGNFTKITDFDVKLTVSRGYGIRFNLFLQDFNQLDSKYGKEIAAIIRGNCLSWIYLATNDDDTKERISKNLGEYTTTSYSYGSSIQRYSSASSSENVNLHGRRLLTADEIGRIDRPYQLVLSQSYPVIMFAPDLSKWMYNKMLGLGDEDHNTALIKMFNKSRGEKHDMSEDVMLWKPWTNYIRI